MPTNTGREKKERIERKRVREVTPKPLSVCSSPARKSGKAENIPEAPTVIVRLEVGDALTQEERSWDGNEGALFG